jgi:hypothetical protein
VNDIDVIKRLMRSGAYERNQQKGNPS